MVSIIIPAYNCARYLEATVQSVLAQTYRDFEVLILDDCSTDGSADLIRRLAEEDCRIRVLSNEKNLGVAQTRNRGLEAARGEYIAFLDSDDTWLSDKLERQMECMRERTLDLCYTGYSFINESGEPIRNPYQIAETLTWEHMLGENIIGLSTVLVRLGAIGTIRMRGEYAHEDYVFWLELMQSGCKAGGINLPLMRYRVSESNRSGDKRKAALGRWVIYRRFLRMGFFQSLWWFAQYGMKGLWKIRQSPISRES